MADPTQPISVAQSAVPTAFLAVFRYVFVAGLSFASGKGWITTDTSAQVLLQVPAIAVGAWGVWTAISNSRDKKAMEPYVPNSVAKPAGT